MKKKGNKRRQRTKTTNDVNEILYISLPLTYSLIGRANGVGTGTEGGGSAIRHFHIRRNKMKILEYKIPASPLILANEVSQSQNPHFVFFYVSMGR